MATDGRLKVLFAASEAVPFVKTGGLGDVVGALPKEFDKDIWDVRVVLPNYTCIPPEYRDKFTYISDFMMDLGDYVTDKYVGVMTYEYEGITYYFIDDLYYFECFYPYTSDVRWDIERFDFFSKAVLSMLPVIDFKPDVIHCNDWQTALIPVYLKTKFTGNPFFWDIQTVITIHNLKFQGIWNIDDVKGISGLPDDLFTSDKLEFHGMANILKGGICYADYITTVSDTYAKEIQTPEFGEGLDGLLKSRRYDLKGIVNGIDYNSYNPKTDIQIYKNYSSKDFTSGKRENKSRLQKDLGLKVDHDRFLIGIVSRLTEQKGLDLIRDSIGNILDGNTQLVVVGTGDASYENMFKHYDWVFRGSLSANIYYSEELSRKVYAAADAFLMPSKFEPCGLSQLISFRYGTVPIVRETGGLKDTVIPYNEYEDTGDGFSFAYYSCEDMIGTINYAKRIFFERKDAWKAIARRGMAADFSWKNSMEKYAGIYRHLIARD